MVQWLFLLLLIFIFSFPANAARLELKNGDRISGQWLDSNEETVRFVSDYGSVVRIPRDQISAFYNDHGISASLPVGAKDLPPPDIAGAEIKTDAPGLLRATWSGRAEAGAGLQTGNSDQKSLNADLETRAKWQKDRANLDLDYNWQESDDERTQDNRQLAGNFDQFLAPAVLGDDKWYVNYNGLLRQDKVADLDLRSVLGVGLGRQFYETEETYLSASLGPSWLRQKFEDGETQSSIAARWNIDYDQKFQDNLFSLYHRHSLYLPSDDIAAYIFDAESGVRIPLRGGFSAIAEWQLNINKDPAPGTDSEDSIYSLKLGYEW